MRSLTRLRSAAAVAIFLGACTSSDPAPPTTEPGAGASGAGGGAVAGSGGTPAGGSSGSAGAAGSTADGASGGAAGVASAVDAAAGPAGTNGQASTTDPDGSSGAGGSPTTRDARANEPVGNGADSADGPRGDSAASRGTEGGALDGSGGPRASDAAGPANITVWLAGDSTMADGLARCPVGWGKQFQPHFRAGVTVNNRAIGGTSLSNWTYQMLDSKDPATGECARALDASGKPLVTPQWQAMLDGMKAGDYLLVQFGINDGAGGVCPRATTDATFKAILGEVAKAAKDRKANPIFLTPVSSIACTGSLAQGTRGRFVTDTMEAGAMFDVPVIDLHKLSVALYTSSGFCPLPGGAADVSATTAGAVGAFFCDDHTHFEATGATAIAQVVADAIQGQGLGLAPYVK